MSLDNGSYGCIVDNGASLRVNLGNFHRLFTQFNSRLGALFTNKKSEREEGTEHRNRVDRVLANHSLSSTASQGTSNLHLQTPNPRPKPIPQTQILNSKTPHMP